MPDSMPRVALILAGIVAIVVLSLGINDYVQQKKQPEAAAAASTPTVANAKAKPRCKRASTRARLSMHAVNAPAPAQSAAPDLEKQLINGQFAAAGAATMALRDDAPNSSRTPASYNTIKASDKNRLRNELDMIASPSSSACLPLPNLTGPGDVDAPYYDNWAGEYCDR